MRRTIELRKREWGHDTAKYCTHWSARVGLDPDCEHLFAPPPTTATVGCGHFLLQQHSSYETS
ncbi:hypothetical protein MUK42_34061 [Musa troglodytarum]|uniref:Uncharacterized protein n=1 Tax=Musa troglodytarum TaxID=320322 RepID=A0A9E7JAL5_9LILI|nr:hypothetical protein MUK42_34061 [Musa troglodytarum]